MGFTSPNKRITLEIGIATKHGRRMPSAQCQMPSVVVRRQVREGTFSLAVQISGFYQELVMFSCILLTRSDRENR